MHDLQPTHDLVEALLRTAITSRQDDGTIFAALTGALGAFIGSCEPHRRARLIAASLEALPKAVAAYAKPAAKLERGDA